MSRALRWLLVLVCLGGLAYAAVALPIGGRTLWERVQGEGPPAARPAGQGTAPAAAGPAGAPSAVKLAPGGEPAPASDMHSESERQALDRLIEDRLKADGDASGAPKR